MSPSGKLFHFRELLLLWSGFYWIDLLKIDTFIRIFLVVLFLRSFLDLFHRIETEIPKQVYRLFDEAMFQEKTCYKSINNLRFIYFSTNSSPNSSQNTSVLCTGLYDFERLLVIFFNNILQHSALKEFC